MSGERRKREEAGIRHGLGTVLTGTATVSPICVTLSPLLVVRSIPPALLPPKAIRVHIPKLISIPHSEKSFLCKANPWFIRASPTSLHNISKSFQPSLEYTKKKKKSHGLKCHITEFNFRRNLFRTLKELF